MNTIERKVTNVTTQKSQEPIQLGNTPIYMFQNQDNDYYTMVIGRFKIAEDIVNEDAGLQWCKDNILDIVPTIVVAMLETQKEILNIVNR